jgi:hypothetical protein
MIFVFVVLLFLVGWLGEREERGDGGRGAGAGGPHQEHIVKLKDDQILHPWVSRWIHVSFSVSILTS